MRSETLTARTVTPYLSLFTLHPQGFCPLGCVISPVSHLPPPTPIWSSPLLSLPVSCFQSRFFARLLSLPSPCLAALPSAPPPPRLFQPNGRVPAGGGRVLGVPELPSRLPLGRSFRPSLAPFPVCPLPRISPDGSARPAHPSHSRSGLTLPPAVLPYVLFFPVPFASFSSQLLSPLTNLLPTLPRSPSSIPTPHFTTPQPPTISPNCFPRPLSHNPQTFTPPLHTPISDTRAPALFL